MKKVITLCISALLASGVSVSAAPFGKMSGAYTVPSPTFSSLRQIIDTLNFYGVKGPVTIDVDRDETAPSGGYMLGSDSLNHSLGPTTTLTINGKNHILTAPVGSGSTDGIFKLCGPDFVTINDLHLQESSANTTATTMMEWGYALVRRTFNDGCQSIAIQRCRIVLNKANTTAASGVSGYGATGIFVGNCLPNSTTGLAASVIDSAMQNGIFLFQDTVINANNGIYANGTQVAIDGITYNDYGLTIQGNVIHNFSHYGIRMAFFNNDLVKSNYIDNMADGGSAPTTNNIYGIAYQGATTATNNSWRTDGNHIKLTIDGTSSTGTEAIGVYTGVFGSGTTEISGDSVELTALGTGNGLHGIVSDNNQGTQTIKDNLIWNFSTSGVTTGFTIGGIRNGQMAAPFGYPAKSLIRGNRILDFNVATTAQVNGIADRSSTAVGPDIQANLIDNITIIGNASAFRGITTGQLSTSPVTHNAVITDNIISNIKATGTSTPGIGIRPIGANNLTTTTVTSNTIKNFEFGTGNVVGVEVAYASKATINKDTIDNLKSGANVFGIRSGVEGNSAVGTIEFLQNLIRNINTTAGTAQGIGISAGSGTTVTTTATINKNKIYSVIGSGVSDTVAAIAVRGGNATYTIINNMIGDIAASGNTTVFSSTFGISMQSTGTNKLLSNTINLKTGTTAGTGYGATGILFHPSGTNTIQNNIVRVNIASATGNNVAALRAAFGVAGSAPSVSAFTANNNIYFVPEGSTNFLYAEGTTLGTIVNAYSVSGLVANTTNNIVNDTFFNSDCDKSSYHKFMNAASAGREKGTYTENNLIGTSGSYAPTGISYAESGAADLPAVADDITGTSRPSGTSDIGAFEFNGTTIPKMDIVVTSSSGRDTACILKLPTLTASVPAFFGKVSYQWYKGTTEIAGANTSKLLIDADGGNYVVHVFDSVSGCEYIDEGFKITIVPPPAAMVTYYDTLVFCESSAVALHGTPGYGYTYQWYKDGSVMTSETKDHYVASKTGNYSIEITSSFGCANRSEPVRVTVYPLPKPSVYWVGPSVLGTQKYYTYQWYKDNVKIPGAIGQSFFTTDDGAYTVEVTDSNGCTNKSDVYLFTVSVDEQQLGAAIKIFPNPAKDQVFIQSPVPVYAELTDMTGRVVLERAQRSTADLTSLAEGMYLLRVTDKDGNLVRNEKLIRVK